MRCPKLSAYRASVMVRPIFKYLVLVPGQQTCAILVVMPSRPHPCRSALLFLDLPAFLIEFWCPSGFRIFSVVKLPGTGTLLLTFKVQTEFWLERKISRMAIFDKVFPNVPAGPGSERIVYLLGFFYKRIIFRFQKVWRVSQFKFE